MASDPAGVLQKLERVEFNDERFRSRLQGELVKVLAAREFEEAAALAESIADPKTRSSALVYLSDLLPRAERNRKLALLDRGLEQARIATAQSDRLLAMGELADRWAGLGETARAKSLFSEGLKSAGQLLDKTDSSRSRFAARLARIDLPAALAIANDFATDRRQGNVLLNIAFGVAAENPAEAERIWSMTRPMSRQGALDPALAWRLGTIDPARAKRALEGMPWINQRPEVFLYLALGTKARDESAFRHALQVGLQGIDRILQKGPDRAQLLLIAGSLLPVVERIDPALVPEILWRGVAAQFTGR